MASTLQDFIDEVEKDPKCKELQEKLLAYAKEEVSKHKSDIAKNLKRMRKRPDGSNAYLIKWPLFGPLLEIDLLWPGAGYNSVCCGGNYEVLCLLEKQGIVKVGDVCGASGGAASTILALADPGPSSKTLLHYYMVYAKWAATTWDPQVWQATCLWSDIYRKVIENDGAWDRVRKRALCAVAAGVEMNNVVMYDFKTRNQAVVAFTASGEASVMGVMQGWKVDEVSEKIGSVCDGGKVVPFPGRSRKVQYYHTFYGYATTCNLESIETLFKEGVDETINMLKSADLFIEPRSAYDNGLEVAMYGEGGMFVCNGNDCSKAKFETSIGSQALFVDVADGKEQEFPLKEDEKKEDQKMEQWVKDMAQELTGNYNEDGNHDGKKYFVRQGSGNKQLFIFWNSYLGLSGWYLGREIGGSASAWAMLDQDSPPEKGWLVRGQTHGFPVKSPLRIHMQTSYAGKTWCSVGVAES